MAVLKGQPFFIKLLVKCFFHSNHLIITDFIYLKSNQILLNMESINSYIFSLSKGLET